MLWYQTIPKWFQNLFPSLEWRVKTDEKKVYLTFDDGPHPEITDWVMEQLKRYDMKGTFFCVGDNARKYPDVLERILSNGHALGNHTMHHLKGWNTPVEEYVNNVKACENHFKTKLFRPPYGRISGKQIEALKANYRIIMWDLLACDFEKKLNQEKALKGLMKNTRNGSIVVFHDSVKAEQNLRMMLPSYLRFLNEKGYQCNCL